MHVSAAGGSPLDCVGMKELYLDVGVWRTAVVYAIANELIPPILGSPLLHAEKFSNCPTTLQATVGPNTFSIYMEDAEHLAPVKVDRRTEPNFLWTSAARKTQLERRASKKGPAQVNISADEEPFERAAISKLVAEYRDIFANGPEEVGRCGLLEYDIILKSGEIVTSGKSRPVPVHLQQAVAEEISQMLTQGVIQKSDSP